MQIILKLSFACILITLISSCAEHPTAPAKMDIIEKSNEQHTRDLLIQAWKTTSLAESSQLRLQAARILLSENQLDQAKAVYQLINYRDLDTRYSEDFVLIGLKLANHFDDTSIAELALALVKDGLFSNLPISQRIEAIDLTAHAYEMLAQHLTAAKIRIENASLFTGDAYQSNHAKIWTNLSQSALSDLAHAGDPIPTDFEMAGWVTLAITIKQNQYNLDEQLAALALWQKQWPGHPATLTPPEELLILASLPEKRPESIVLALPLTGPLANAGNAVREGFMAAYYNDPFRNKNKTEIKIIDTAKSEHFTDIYLEHTSNQPDLIIGPLSKSDVNELSNMQHLPIPVLALNYATTTTEPPSNLYQFGLSNEDELRQVTEQAWNEGARHIVSFCPENEWGWRMCELVREEWEGRNGIVLETVFFDTKGEHTKLIETTFKVDESKNRASELNRILPERAELTPRRRQDIDAIILLSRPQNARQLKPLFAFFYAGDIPVYSTSSVYDGKYDKIKDQDLNGIVFTDIPWILNQTNFLKTQLHKKQPELAKQYDRLFALGSDAYLLAPRVAVFNKINTAAINGNTGLLKMSTRRQIQRTLDWAVFSDGEAKPVSKL